MKATLFVLFVTLTTGPIYVAQHTTCKDREIVLKSLTGKYGEQRNYVGLGVRGNMWETYSSQSRRTWTIIVTLPTGKTCVVAFGDNFEQDRPAEPLPKGNAL